MRVYKATNHDMTCHMGKGVFQYKLGESANADACKCASTGLHACEYVLDCMKYYQLGYGHRFFAAEAEGNIAEDGVDTRISCTQLTLLNELDNKMIGREAMFFMLKHPKRSDWQRKGNMLMVAENEASMEQKDGIAIARGPEPRVKGCMGAHVGWIREVDGKITEAFYVTVQAPMLPDTWYTIEEAKNIEKGWWTGETERNSESTD